MVEKETGDHCVADICSFVMHQCVYEKGEYFKCDNGYVWHDKYEKIRNWPEKLVLGDYKMAGMFDD